MTARPQQPLADMLVKYWPLLVVGVLSFGAYVEQRTTIGSIATEQTDLSTAVSKISRIDALLLRHLNEPAHGNAGIRLSASEREIAILAAQMREILRRLKNIDEKIEANGSRR